MKVIEQTTNAYTANFFIVGEREVKRAGQLFARGA